MFTKIVGCIALGNTLGPLVSGLLLKNHGFFLPLLVNALLCSVTIILLGEEGGREGGREFDMQLQHNSYPSFPPSLPPSLPPPGWRVKESLDPADTPREPFRPLRQHNTFVVLYQFLFTHRHGHAGGREGGREEGKRGVPPLMWLSACFCLAFSDLVGQGTMFIYYAKRVFHWKPDTLG